MPAAFVSVAAAVVPVPPGVFTVPPGVEPFPAPPAWELPLPELPEPVPPVVAPPLVVFPDPVVVPFPLTVPFPVPVPVPAGVDGFPGPSWPVHPAAKVRASTVQVDLRYGTNLRITRPPESGMEGQWPCGNGVAG